MTKLILRPSHPRFINRLPYLGSVTMPLMKTAFTTDEMPDTFSLMHAAANITENEKQFEIDLAVPGFSKEDITVDCDSHTLKVSGVKHQEDKDIKYHIRQFGFSSFSRAFRMPETADMEQVNANYADGILKITIAKLQKPEPRKIEVK